MDNLRSPSQTRQWLELAAAVLAIALVGSVLALVFRGSDDGTEQQLGAEGTPIPSPAGSGRLYVVSHAYQPGEDSVRTLGHVAAFDQQTGAQVYAFDTGPRIDAMLSPDGSRLYVATSDPDGDLLTAYDAGIGQEVWQSSVQDRAWWKPGTGAMPMAVSHDGQQVFLYGCSGCTGMYRVGNGGDHWLQIFDASTGEKLRDVPTPTCDEQQDLAPQFHVSADKRTLYVVCLAGRTVQAVDLTSGEITEIPGIAWQIAGSASSADGRLLYVLAADSDRLYSMVVIDMDTRTTSRTASVVNGSQTSRLLPLLALSPDGTTLYVGVNDLPGIDGAAAHTVFVYDAATLQSKGSIVVNAGISWQPFATAGDNQSVFAVSDVRRTADSLSQTSILRLSPDSSPSTFVTLPVQDIQLLLTGPVPAGDTPSPSFQAPDSLPVGLTLSSRHESGGGQELFYVGDSNRVVNVDVWPIGIDRRLTLPSNAYELTAGTGIVSVIPDPEGGWPRGAIWTHGGYVFDLSVISSPTAGWTNDDLLSVVLALAEPE